MGLTKRLVVSASIVVFNLACMVTSFPQVFPTNTPTSAFVEEVLPIATSTRIPFPTLTPPPTSTPPYPTAPPVPAWIDEFANPILKALEGRRPDFQSDFSSTLNQGWFLALSTGRRAPANIHLQGESLLLILPEGTERKDITLNNRRLTHKNFVLSFDFKFGKTEPDDILRFQFRQATGQSVYLDMSKNESWIYYWSLYNDVQYTTGVYEYFSPEWINALIIMRGDECAALLNQEPLDYLSNCRVTPIGRLSPLAVSLHLLSPKGYATVVIDNIKVWDLDKIPELP